MGGATSEVTEDNDGNRALIVGKLQRTARAAYGRGARLAHRGLIAAGEVACARLDRSRRGARAATLLHDLDARAHRPHVAGTALTPAQPIALRAADVERLLGVAIPADRVAAHLTALGCHVDANADGRLSVTPPPWRRDLTIAADLVEEVARIEGYDRIPGDRPVRFPHTRFRVRHSIWRTRSPQGSRDWAIAKSSRTHCARPVTQRPPRFAIPSRKSIGFFATRSHRD